MFKYYNHLGFFNPYYIDNGDKPKFRSLFSEIMKLKNDQNIIDIPSLISILDKGYVIGDNTLIKGVKRGGWMSKYCNGWKQYNQLIFSDSVSDIKSVGEKFVEHLKNEIKEYVYNHKRIGILLSGGMDSRIVAGILILLIEEKEILPDKIIALSWGDARSRDVIYSQKIANRFGWGFIKFDISSATFIRNMETTYKEGCEFSPSHLHAMLDVSEFDEVDCILAGSFGDSVGRGEYSGKNIKQLKRIDFDINNKFKLLDKEIFESNKFEVFKNVDRYWEMFPQMQEFQQIEQDYQIHYMRRLLNPCMSIVNNKVKVYQVFSSPNVVKHIWSLSPSLRDNRIYLEVLNRIHPFLKEIPWARTGLKFGSSLGKPDNYLASYERELYSEIFKKDLLPIIQNRVFNGVIENLNIFNMTILEKIFKVLNSPIYTPNLAIEEKMIWFASFSKFVEHYNVIGLKSKSRRTNSLDDNLIYVKLAKEMLKYYYRKIYYK